MSNVNPTMEGTPMADEDQQDQGTETTTKAPDGTETTTQSPTPAPTPEPGDEPDFGKADEGD